MSKKLMSLVAAGLLMSAVTYASDAWKDKDFQNWDQKDVQKILTDSPWSKKFQYASGGGAPTISRPLQSLGGAAGPGGGGATTGGAGSPANPAGRGASGPEEPDQQINLTVSWYSSRTIREAMARQRELAGTPPDEARKKLAEPATGYEVAVSGPDLAAFGKFQDDDLQAHSYLMARTTKEKMSPSNVIILRGQNDQPTAIIFEFAKTTASGGPTIAQNDKGVVFSTQAGSIPIKVQFDLSKMTDKQGADY